ncbi:type IV secretion system protein TrbL [Sphingomonas sp. SORGH_AS 950]|uniref:P-type conjugative transfer protein TrbL n=1 Tax=Sphingomonas sp. SORGH_AS_0950 TaxID=3041792 RepID=UPI00278B9B89|nr:P-type conjugative transfer protein TrbL [Sphingomonas sp. SORGH_AS_0950]MDQ1158948.1 type IV secretion system protein TrbL [Sphingomonas sp. SORGH_AS_0950]
MADPGAPDLNVIDQFVTVFSHYIDSGFGLLRPDVGFLTTTLIGIDIVLAGLWWSLDGENDILARLVKKILYVGVFALILNNYQHFTQIIYESFSGLGLHASANAMSAQDLLKPGKIAGTGFKAAQPLLDQAGKQIGFYVPALAAAAVMVVAWLLVVLAFFILAIQLFITIVEFKLTSLAGFTLVPFALWNKTSFLAERVLGNIISSGIKVMVLAVIIGIGSSFFHDFIATSNGAEIDTAQAMSLVLGALALLGLGIFGPGIATGLVSGAPQLGAGAAVGTMGGATLATGGAAMLGARAAITAGSGGMAAIRAGTAMGAATQTAWRSGQAAAGEHSISAGFDGLASAAKGAAGHAATSTFSRVQQGLSDSAQRGRDAAMAALGGESPRAGAGAEGSGEPAKDDAAPNRSADSSPPLWARKMRSEQTARHRVHAAMQIVKEGDRPGAPANPDLSDKEN